MLTSARLSSASAITNPSVPVRDDLRLASNGAVLIDDVLLLVRPPLGHRHHAGLDEFQTVEEPGEAGRAAQVVLRNSGQVPDASRLNDLRRGVGAVVHSQVAP